MILQNLSLHFDRQEDKWFVFKSDEGKEVAFDSSLLTEENKESILYLNLDDNQNSVDFSKDILNDILEN